MCKNYELKPTAITAITDSMPGAVVAQEDFEVLILFNGKLRSFSPQLIAQLPNKSVSDYLISEFTTYASVDIPSVN